MLIESFIIGIIIFSGVWSSYTDIKHRRIKNTCIIFLLISAILVNFVLFPSDIGGTLINFLIAFFSVFLIWWCGLWSAADGKLFLGYAALIPISFYRFGISFFPSMNILVNTFTPLFIVLGLQTLLRTTHEQKKNVIKKLLSPKFILRMALILLSMRFLFGWISPILGIPQNYFIDIFLLFVVIDVIERISPIDLSFIYIIVSVVGIYSSQQMLNIQFLLILVKSIFAFIFLRFFLISLSEHAFLRPVKIKDLKEGMLPSEIILQNSRGKYGKERIFYVSIFSLLRRKNKKIVLDYKPDGLTREDVEWLKKIHRKRETTFNDLSVHTTLPFAPFIFFGALITVVLHGSIITFLQQLIL